jgi:hypothetical protein
MKISKNLHLAVCAALITSCITKERIEYSEWVAGSDYNIAARTSWDAKKDLDDLEFELLHIMQAEVEANKLPDSKQKQLILENTEEGLTSLYTKASLALKRHPNERLLAIMLYHHNRYHSGTASEAWWEAIHRLKVLSKANKKHN